MERFRRLITKDGIKSELQPHHDFQPYVSTALKPSNSGMLAENSIETAIDSLEPLEREYRYRRTITIEIYEYEEK